MNTLKSAVVALAATLVVSAFAGEAVTDRLGFVADSLGPANAWRLIPSVLLQHCSQRVPQLAQPMGEVFNAWSTKNQDLISLVDRTVSKAATAYASAFAIGDSEARDRINATTTQLIVENYLQDERVSAFQVCSDYEKIVTSLSAPGKTAVVRGQVYAVEASLLSRASK